jgi:hypothetical protein
MFTDHYQPYYPEARRFAGVVATLLWLSFAAYTQNDMSRFITRDPLWFKANDY